MPRKHPDAREPRADQAWAWLGALLDAPTRPEPLRHALTDLGFSRPQLVRGLACQLRVGVGQVEHPDPRALAGCRRARVGAIIPILLEHPDPRLAAAGRRWLTVAGMVYEIEPAHVERWLIDDVEIGRILAPALAREGLALLGPSALRRIADAAPTPARRLAAGWLERLHG